VDRSSFAFAILGNAGGMAEGIHPQIAPILAEERPGDPTRNPTVNRSRRVHPARKPFHCDFSEGDRAMKRANTIGAYMLYMIGIAISLAWFHIVAPIVGPLVGALLWARRGGGEVLGGVLGGVVSYEGFFFGRYTWAYFHNEPWMSATGVVHGSLALAFAGAVVGAFVGMCMYPAAEVVRSRGRTGVVSVQAESPKSIGPESPSPGDDQSEPEAPASESTIAPTTNSVMGWSGVRHPPYENCDSRAHWPNEFSSR
jgi:hypothetical protein